MSDKWEVAKDLQKDIGAYADAWRELEGKYLPTGLLARGPQISVVRGDAKFMSGKYVAEGFYKNGEAVPMPEGSFNTGTVDDADPVATAEKLPEIADDTVIVGIVDSGIALGHRRFRDRDGNTRFLAAWQQAAQFDGQTDLPCGREIYAKEINEKLCAHSGGNMTGYLDEDAFNRDLELVDPVRPLGNRDLELSAAHGAHVLDLATGLDPETADPDEMRRLRIIAVNLPAQYSHGSAGNFLAYFAVYAVERILHLADSRWLNDRKAPDEKSLMGYPIVINFSYGMQAGPKDGQHIFEQALESLVRLREDQARRMGWMGASPVRIAMPIGNDNLLRGAASCVLGDGKSVGYTARSCVKLPWRIKPADSTANFLEIWTEAKDEKTFHEVLEGMRIFVSPPGCQEAELASLHHGCTQTLGDREYARAYVQHAVGFVEEGKSGKEEKYKPGRRLGILIAVAATQTDLKGAPQAPAGEWNIILRHDGAAVDVTFYIQSDQAAVRVSRNAQRSYFDHKDYKARLDNGAVADNYSIDPEGDDFENHDNWRKHGPVQRKGTHNAISSIKMDELVVIGGYNDEDGYPATYSASTDGNRQRSKGRVAGTVSYPSENGAQFGLLAAGARDGSVKAYRGTSMATALATRDIAAAFLKDGPDPEVGTQFWLRGESDKFEDDIYGAQFTDRFGKPIEWPPFPDREGKLKMGIGRMPMPDLSRQWSRLGQD